VISPIFDYDVIYCNYCSKIKCNFARFLKSEEVVIVLGIDPGVVVAGYALVSYAQGKVLLLDSGVVKMSSAQSLPYRVKCLHDFFSVKIQEFKVTDLVLETPFLGKNAQNFLKLGYVRGILYLLVETHGLRMHEFSPREVKHALTGYGGADKDQLARVVVRLFPGFVFPEKLDITDAVALALCGLWRGSSVLR
jgi:crossover junction endodeoxyribonuclease RuvC